MSRRDQIQMSDDEVLAFLDEERTLTCATVGPRGWPHLMPLWYTVRDGTIWAWTFAKSQKVKNLERDSRATVQVEAGLEYQELRGVMLECDVAVHRDLEVVLPFGMELLERYSGAAVGEELVRGQAAKRVALEFRERRRATWDHRKLGGTY
ncbi:MAG TPA: pyridoxamine 5'-phosphate oxidase family protein [Baekduia sp.]|nr:pyridoxamine 5'-phosphate oxidase family protein [Baekduia sp.]